MTNFPGKLQDERKLAALFAFFCLSVLHTLRLDRTWSLIMMQTGQNYCWSWSGFVCWFFQFCGFYHCVSVLRKTLRISVEIRTNTGAWQHCYRENCQQDTTVKHRSRAKCKDDLLCSFDNAFDRLADRSKCCATKISMATTHRPVAWPMHAPFFSAARQPRSRGAGALIITHAAHAFFFFLRWACSQRFLQIVVLANRLSRLASKSKNKRTCFDAGWSWGKRKSRLLWLDGIFRSPNIFHCGSVLTVERKS